jgi:hypothetical protein
VVFLLKAYFPLATNYMKTAAIIHLTLGQLKECHHSDTKQAASLNERIKFCNTLRLVSFYSTVNQTTLNLHMT